MAARSRPAAAAIQPHGVVSSVLEPVPGGGVVTVAVVVVSVVVGAVSVVASVVSVVVSVVGGAVSVVVSVVSVVDDGVVGRDKLGNDPDSEPDKELGSEPGSELGSELGRLPPPPPAQAPSATPQTNAAAAPTVLRVHLLRNLECLGDTMLRP